MFKHISNDRWIGVKLAMPYVILFFIINAQVLLFTKAEHPLMWVAGCCLMLPALVWFYRRRMRAAAWDVRVMGSLVCYTCGGRELEVRKHEIREIHDSGWTGPLEIVIRLQDGREICFFPSREYGPYYRGRLMKELREWLVSDG